MNWRILLVAGILGVVATLVAKILVVLIGWVTGISYFGKLDGASSAPGSNHLGIWAIFVPVIGGILVGIMARFGSAAIRGHGIPEAMEQVLTNGSRIPPRVAILKPLSSAIAIGTGGPFGAEGPIIATGGAIGSLIGQLMHTTAHERKILLCAGAAAGMTAIFGSPLAAISLAVELLLFELSPAAVLPVATACVVAAASRVSLFPHGPVFAAEVIPESNGLGIAFSAGLGAFLGWISVWVTRLVYGTEDLFEKLPIHWMWWPAIGGLVVGAIGLWQPRTLGVGYDNITQILNGQLGWQLVAILVLAKFASWTVALGSGTSGGTLAPLLTIGGGLGFTLASVLGFDPRVGAIVGMASLFTGASRAMITTVIFAVETTGCTTAFPNLVAGCTLAYLVARTFQETTIMTEKIARRGISVPDTYRADPLAYLPITEIASSEVITLRGDQTILDAKNSIGPHSHHGFPVVEGGKLIGVITLRQFSETSPDRKLVRHLVTRSPISAPNTSTVREVADLMTRHSVGRVPILDSEGNLVGMVTRSDVLSARSAVLSEHEDVSREIELRRVG